MNTHLFPQLRPQSAASTLPRTVLVVDDDRDQLTVLCDRLERQGYKTLTADSGELGLTLARTQHPDVILLDLRLPDVDGLTVCQELADLPDTSCIPVIILSGMERPDIIRRSRAAGCQFFVRKPYDPNALLILIQQSISESSQWQTA